MKFSNPGYFDLSPEVVLAQQEELTELRHEQHRQLVESGAADRIITSPSVTNSDRDKAALTPETVLYPTRTPIWSMSMMQLSPVCWDAGLPVANGARGAELSVLGDSETQNHVLHIVRYEPNVYGYSTSGYTAGLSLDQMSAEQIGRERYIPFKGVELEDLKLVERQLDEIALVAMTKKFTIIDLLTLSEGPGQIISFEDDDYLN